MTRREERRAEQKSNTAFLLAVVSALCLLGLIAVGMVLYRSSGQPTASGVAKSTAQAEPASPDTAVPGAGQAQPQPEQQRVEELPRPPAIKDPQPLEEPRGKPAIPEQARAELNKLVSYWRFADAEAAIGKLEQSGQYDKSQFADLHKWIGLQHAAAREAHRDTLLRQAHASLPNDPGGALNRMRAALPFAAKTEVIQQINVAIDRLKEAPKEALASRLRALSSFLRTEHYDYVRQALEALLGDVSLIPLHPFIQARLKSLDSKPEGKGLLGRWLRALAEFDIRYTGELGPALGPRRCPRCQGRRFAACPECDEQGTVEGPCNTCNASGKSSCATCKGTGQQTCRRCKGRGAVATTTYTYETCPACYAKGDILCNRCGNTRRIKTPQHGTGDCPDCQRTGSTTCTSCKGKGSRPCRGCKGTGRGRLAHAACGGLHRQYCVQCKGLGGVIQGDPRLPVRQAPWDGAQAQPRGAPGVDEQEQQPPRSEQDAAAGFLRWRRRAQALLEVGAFDQLEGHLAGAARHQAVRGAREWIAAFTQRRAQLEQRAIALFGRFRAALARTPDQARPLLDELAREFPQSPWLRKARELWQTRH